MSVREKRKKLNLIIGKKSQTCRTSLPVLDGQLLFLDAIVACLGRLWILTLYCCVAALLYAGVFLAVIKTFWVIFASLCALFACFWAFSPHFSAFFPSRTLRSSNAAVYKDEFLHHTELKWIIGTGVDMAVRAGGWPFVVFLPIQRVT